MKASELAEIVRGELSGDDNVIITGIASYASAKKGDVAFLDSPATENTSASCLITSQEGSGGMAAAVIRVKDAKLSFALAAEALLQIDPGDWEVHPTAAIADSAELALQISIGAQASIGESSTIGIGTRIGAGVRIGRRVVIGHHCVLHANVVIEDGCAIGDNVIIHAGVVIGADGFGYVRDINRHVKFPQIGTVVIEDDVEIGANSCVDRGALGETRIGAGTKIDNLVQIAHNVQIGKRVIIAAQTGISGSTTLEDDCIIGGQVGMGDHATVKSGAIIGSQAGVLPGKIVRPGVWWGTPVQPLDDYKRQNAHLKGLSRLKDEVAGLRKLIKDND